LIALMQDQAAQLGQMGIATGVLNSALSGDEQSRVMRKAREGEYRLLYLSPERLARADTVAWLKMVPVSFFAIDEAHCISEWGHEFRPEYRQLNSLRIHFPDHPIAAFTASATQRVRHDILHQLQLRNPDKYIASFHRPNLRYLIAQCDGKAQKSLLIRAVRRHAGNNVIVYAPTIARVEETVDFLEEQGIAAVPYHGQMEATTRRRNQELWTSDEVRVLVGTIAFGLGINKAGVRAVIHLSLPKSIEQYYQEAGRAGRDGDPADCVLLWQKRDAGLLAHFIGQISDAAEKDRAWERYHKMREFVESAQCRHWQICTHFGERVKWTSCGACDVCGCDSDWLTKAIGAAAHTRTAAAGLALLPGLSMHGEAMSSASTGIDSELRDYLREWRRATAKEQGVSAFIVMFDTSMDEICRRKPDSLEKLRAIEGFGERKTERYGGQILDALARFRNGARASATQEKRSKPVEEIIRLLSEGESLAHIAAIRGRQLSTIIHTVAELVENGKLPFQQDWVDASKQAKIESACVRLGSEWLKPIKDSLPDDISYDDIRLVLARMRSQRAQESRQAVQAGSA
jgi:ATP-dependent DNA helicase RecQ